jgi:hypothetical protein
VPIQPRSVVPLRRLCAGLIVLVLWMQMLAPVGDLLMRAEAAEAATADAVIHAAICGRDFERDGGTTVATDLPASSTACDRCPLCRCTAVAPAPIVSEATIRRLHWRPASWPTPPPAHEPRPPRLPGLARAPPPSV